LCKTISVRRETINKRKIFNDPVYGFINIPDELILDIIEHPYFQRLRRIKQLGLTHLVYPGALHTRFHHSLGAMHLMSDALSVLTAKGVALTPEERQGALIAILLHDVGHAPFSHALEKSIVTGIMHEDISLIIMNRLNDFFDGQLSLGIDIFKHEYKKQFLSQLVASQLDIDRLDYLTRDSFFTGVSEGVIGTERIIKMLNVADDHIVAEAKGIYSIEKFIVARRLMYWQVYLHKTVLAAENMLIKLLQRAEYLARNGEKLFATPPLRFFLENGIDKSDMESDTEILERYTKIDDFDIFASLKVWAGHDDFILSELSKRLVNRRLFRCEIQPEPFEYFYIEEIKNRISEKYHIPEKDMEYFFYSNTTSNYAYNIKADKINILYKSGKVMDIVEASDQLNISVLSEAVTKHFICYPKDI